MIIKQIIFFLSLSFIPSGVVAETITLVADEWCPYNCDPKSASPGYVVEITKIIHESAGYEVQYINVPWSRAIIEVTEGTYDGAIAATLKEIPLGIFPEEEIGISKDVFIIRKEDTWHYTSIESLQSLRLGVVQDYDYGEPLNTYIVQNMGSSVINVIAGANAAERSLKMLLSERIDTYLEDRNVAQYMAKKMDIYGSIGYGGTIEEPSPLYIAFSPANRNSKRYAQLMSEGIRKMRKSGELAKILEKYGLVDWRQD
jgi:polar amino acid transport system substrate-binding protein